MREDVVHVQNDGHRVLPRRFVELAYNEYAHKYGKQQTFERLQERGGLHVKEIISLLYDRCMRLDGDVKCAACGKTYEEHKDGPLDRTMVARMPCLGYKINFIRRT